MFAMIPSPVLRTSSATSILSADDMVAYDHDNPKIPRKRKRFTSAQLAVLETLFYKNSHPTREEREDVARTGGMEVKSVTIWFQNKRQTERRVALMNSTDTGRTLVTTTSLASTSTRTHSPTFSTASSRPSLDSVASRTEQRTSTPHTPTRRRGPSSNLWDNMPSSPVVSPVSPPALAYVKMAKNQRVRRTLEWACAAARLAEKEGANGSSPTRRVRSRERQHQRPHHRHSQRHHEHHKSAKKADADLTEEEPDETVTPTGSWIKDDRHRWVARSDGAVQVAAPSVPKVSPEAHGDDSDVMRAALALCGLGRCS